MSFYAKGIKVSMHTLRKKCGTSKYRGCYNSETVVCFRPISEGRIGTNSEVQLVTNVKDIRMFEEYLL